MWKGNSMGIQDKEQSCVPFHLHLIQEAVQYFPVDFFFYTGKEGNSKHNHHSSQISTSCELTAFFFLQPPCLDVLLKAAE